MGISTSIKLSPFPKRLLLIVALFNGLVVGVVGIAGSFSAPSIYKKDFISPYLMAKAITAGLNPYLPLPDLARDCMNIAGYDHLDHPTSHPPAVGLLSLPLGTLSYETAAVVWLVFELACLLASVWLLLRWWGGPVRMKVMAVVFGVVLGWLPVVEDLWLGQFSSCMLLLLLGAWLALRARREAVGGALLGGLIALKLMAWPVVVFLALRRQWRGVIAAVSVTAAANLLAMAVLGFGCVKDYYLKVGPLVASLYRSNDCNYSMWTVGERLFKGFGNHFYAPPLWPSASLATIGDYAAPLAVLILGLALALKAASFDTALGLLICVSILVSPIAWSHYLMFALIPLAITARRLRAQGWPRKMTYLAIGLALPLLLTEKAYTVIVRSFASGTTPGGDPVVPFTAGLLTLIPAASLLGLLWLVWQWDRIESPQDGQVAPESELGRLPLGWLPAIQQFYGRR